MTRSIWSVVLLVQAVIAGALSFAHLHDIAAAAGQSGWKAWAYPISVDLLMVSAWRRLRAQHSSLAWCWFLIALVSSLGANIATAGFLDLAHPPALLRLGVAGWPALAFLGGTLLVHAAEPSTDPAVPTASVLDVERAAAPTPESEPVTVPPVDGIPALPAADPAPAAPAPATSVPPALVAHARKVADDHRARTGNEIDPDTLRARLGVPAPMAAAIAAQLT
ncbi:DUF2637 domain-containing protein [Streptomyces sp. NPDC085866]|uniref:DUF2637 domain-containing protein n=1 Tax=Streptomyces sp. NPDC085866 TaxID=3365736 RepID=UPI0037D0F770